MKKLYEDVGSKTQHTKWCLLVDLIIKKEAAPVVAMDKEDTIGPYELVILKTMIETEWVFKYRIVYN